MAVALRAFLAIEDSLSSRLIKSWESYSRPLLQRIWLLMRDGNKAEAVHLANSIDLSSLVKDNGEHIAYLGHAALLFGATRITRHAKLTQIARGKHTHVVTNASILLEKAIVQNVEDAIRKALLEKIAAWDLANPTTHFAPGENPEDHGLVLKYSPDQPRRPSGESGGGQFMANGAEHLEGSLGMRRHEMPQIAQADMAEFMTFARRKGIRITETTEVVGKLKPAQNEFNREHAKQLTEEMLAKPITVSRDNYVLDGTNRWKRLSEDNPRKKIAVRRINLPAKRALALMHSFPKSFSKHVARVGKAELGDYVEPFQSFQGDIFSVASGTLGMASALHTSRLSAFGFTVEADVRNLQTYQINAQLDSKTCPVCEVLDGKEFPIDSATKLLRSALGADDPNDLKTIQPWPPQDKRSVEEIAGMSDDDLIAHGWNVPPFHPWCRCILTGVGEGTLTSETPSAQAAEGFNVDGIGEPVVGAAFANLTATEINQIRDDLAGLTGEDAANAWENLKTEGYTTEELEDIFQVAEADVLAGKVTFPS